MSVCNMITFECLNIESLRFLLVCRYILRIYHKLNNCREQGRLVPQLVGWGPTMYWYPNFLAVVFKKARNFTATSYQNAGFSI